MSLAARLDRLRGVARPRGLEADPQTDVAAAPRSGSRGEAGLPAEVRRPVRAGRSAVASGGADLAQALGAERLGDGLLLCRREVVLQADDARLHDLPDACGFASADWVYLDTETTGLSGGVGNLAFMVGVARYRRAHRLELHQYLLDGFTGEGRMLAALADWIGPHANLVSYNGKCFDLPLLQARCRVQRLAGGLSSAGHLDLMHVVRRAFRRHWPDCRLQTAERRLLDLHRVDDLPGAEAPAAWQAWLGRGDARRLAGVLAHNHQDVVSLARLHRRLVRVYAGGGDAGIDHAAVGMAWLRAGRPAQARQVWESAGRHLDARGRLQLAALHRRRGCWAEAEALWLELHAAGDATAACELSKLYEHRRHDYRRALAFAAACTGEERAARLQRLQHKLGDDRQLPLLQRDPAINR